MSKLENNQGKPKHENEEKTFDKNAAQPPDGGWGWLIVMASFLCNFVLDGIGYSFGIFLPKIEEFYNAPKAKVSWVGSLLYGCYLIIGPIASALTNRYGCRVVAITGSIVSCLAFLLATQAPNVEILMLTCGVMGGIGFGLMFLPAIVSVGSYFSKKRALATGIAVCGSGVGSFAFPPICQKLLEPYGWKGAFATLAGLCLSCSIFGALMRPLEAKSRKKPPIPGKDEKDKEMHVPENTPENQYVVNEKSKESTKMQPIDEISIKKETAESITVSMSKTSNSSSPRKNAVAKDVEELFRSAARVHLFLGGNTDFHQESNGSAERMMGRLPFTEFDMRLNSTVALGQTVNEQYGLSVNSENFWCSWCRTSWEQIEQLEKKCSYDVFGDISVAKNSVRVDLSTASMSTELKPCHSNKNILKRLAHTIDGVLDFSLLKNRVFLLLCVSNATCMIGFLVPYTYIVDSSVIKGISSDRAAFLLSVIGIANTLARLFFGFLSDRPGVSALLVNNVSTALAGLCITCMPFCSNYESLVIICVLFGFTASPFMCLTSIIMVELLGLDMLTNSFGLMSLFRGSLSIVGPPLAGLLHDATSSYDISFYVAGVLLIMSSALSTVPLVQKRLSEATADVPGVASDFKHDEFTSDINTVV